MSTNIQTLRVGGHRVLSGSVLLVGVTIIGGILAQTPKAESASAAAYLLFFGTIWLVLLLLAAFAVRSIFSAQTVRIDTTARTVEICSGWTWRRGCRRLTSGELQSVAIHLRSYLGGGGAGTPTSGRTYYYSVSFEPFGQRCELLRTTRYTRARAFAEQLAKSLGLSLSDGSQSKVVERHAGELEEPVSQRASRSGKNVPLRALPAKSRLQPIVVDDELRVALPRFGRFQWSSLLGLGVITFFVVLIFRGQGRSTLSIPLGDVPGAWFTTGLSAGFAIILVLAALLVAFVFAMTRETVVVSTSRLLIERRLMLFKWTRSFPNAMLKELIDGQDDPKTGTRALIALGDGRRVVFARTLAPGERRWLRAAILHTLASGPPRLKD